MGIDLTMTRVLVLRWASPQVAHHKRWGRHKLGWGRHCIATTRRWVIEAICKLLDPFLLEHQGMLATVLA